MRKRLKYMSQEDKMVMGETTDETLNDLIKNKSYPQAGWVSLRDYCLLRHKLDEPKIGSIRKTIYVSIMAGQEARAMSMLKNLPAITGYEPKMAEELYRELANKALIEGRMRDTQEALQNAWEIYEKDPTSDENRSAELNIIEARLLLYSDRMWSTSKAIDVLEDSLRSLRSLRGKGGQQVDEALYREALFYRVRAQSKLGVKPLGRSLRRYQLFMGAEPLLKKRFRAFLMRHLGRTGYYLDVWLFGN